MANKSINFTEKLATENNENALLKKIKITELTYEIKTLHVLNRGFRLSPLFARLGDTKSLYLRIEELIGEPGFNAWKDDTRSLDIPVHEIKKLAEAMLKFCSIANGGNDE